MGGREVRENVPVHLPLEPQRSSWKRGKKRPATSVYVASIILFFPEGLKAQQGLYSAAGSNASQTQKCRHKCFGLSYEWGRAVPGEDLFHSCLWQGWGRSSSIKGWTFCWRLKLFKAIILLFCWNLFPAGHKMGRTISGRWPSVGGGAAKPAGPVVFKKNEKGWGNLLQIGLSRVRPSTTKPPKTVCSLGWRCWQWLRLRPAESQADLQPVVDEAAGGQIGVGWGGFQ